jgi:hypothetical protein
VSTHDPQLIQQAAHVVQLLVSDRNVALNAHQRP